MCGIVGIFYKQHPKQSGQGAGSPVPAMLESIRHRGNNQTDWADYGACQLGMVRLSIIDQSHDPIPYDNEEGNIHLVFNGEIYNHKSIRRNLSRKHLFKTDSDTEVMVHAYEEKGIGMLHDLNGMFSIALYDEKEHALFLCRDRAGEKFLYYYEDDEKVIFGSEIKAILRALPGKQEAHAFSYEMFEACFGEETLFKDIKLIPPGHYLRFCGSQKTKVGYWTIGENQISIPDDPGKIESDLTDLIVDAVMLRAGNRTQPFGALVSGGIDSSLIAAIAKPDFIYTCTYEGLGSEFSEIEYAQALAQHVGKPLNVVRPTKEDFLSTREEVAYHLDTPCTWTSFNLYMTFQAISKKTNIVLTGEGMDELFAGYHRYHLLHHDMQIRKLEALENYDFLINKYYGKPADRYIKLINRSEKIFQEPYRKYMESLVYPYFDVFEDNVLHAMGAIDFYSTLQIILQMSDRMSMAHTVEGRSPFLDHRLIEYAFSMPEKYKIQNGTTKYIIKKIASKFLPAKLVERKDKRGFLLPFNVWFPSGLEKYDRGGYKEMVYQDWRKVFFEGTQKDG